MINKIIITGSTGLIGKSICKTLLQQGKEITIFTLNLERARKEVPGAINYVKWDYNNPDEWKEYLSINDAVIHLAGAGLSSKRWNAEYKKEIYNSRILSTRQLVNVIKDCDVKPKVFISASAVGIYGDKGDEVLTENNVPANDFLAGLCFDWEKEAKKIEELNVRRVSIRIGLVLSKDGGVLKQFLLPYKMFVGGPLGNGRQWFPWIHIDDLTDIFIYTLDNDSLEGPLNCASPGIVRMKSFAKVLGKVLHRPSIFPVPKFVIKIIAGEIADAVVSGQRISVNKLLASGYNFRFENIENALRNILE